MLLRSYRPNKALSESLEDVRRTYNAPVDRTGYTMDSWVHGDIEVQNRRTVSLLRHGEVQVREEVVNVRVR